MILTVSLKAAFVSISSPELILGHGFSTGSKGNISHMDLQTAFLHHLDPPWYCPACIRARLLLSYFWVMPALLTYAWVTSLHLQRPGAIQHLSTWQCTKISVPGRQTSRAGSALPLAHLALLFHRSSVLSCKPWPLCACVYLRRTFLQRTSFRSNSPAICQWASTFISDIEQVVPPFYTTK